jgi:hypothetical protein
MDETTDGKTEVWLDGRTDGRNNRKMDTLVIWYKNGQTNQQTDRHPNE